jgi:hypothetical protein
MLPQALKLKVIQQYKAAKLQKDIAHDLGISTGSVSTILKASKNKQKYEGNSDSIPQEQPKQLSVVAKDTVLKPEYSDLQIISQPQSQEIQNIQQQQPLVSSQEPPFESKDEPSGGCPLSRFILQEDLQPQIPEVNNLDIEHPKIPSPKEDRFSPNYTPVNQSTTITSPGKTSQPSADIEDIDFDEYSDPDYDPEIYTDPDAEYDPTYDGDPSNSLEEGWDSEPERSEKRIQTTARPTRQLESFRTQKQEEWPRYKPGTALSNHQDSPGWDPDNEQSAQTRILKTIIAEREKRAAELLEIQRQRRELEEEQQKLDQQNNDLKAREAKLNEKLNEIGPLLPSVRELQSAGITFDLIIPYVMAINEKSALENNMDLKAAAYDIVHSLREYRDLGSLRRAIEKAEQKLSALDAFTTRKQAAITTLMDLQMAGFSEKEIMELTWMVNTWNARSGIASLSHSNGNGCKKLDTELFG